MAIIKPQIWPVNSVISRELGSRTVLRVLYITGSSDLLSKDKNLQTFYE